MLFGNCNESLSRQLPGIQTKDLEGKKSLSGLLSLDLVCFLYPDHSSRCNNLGLRCRTPCHGSFSMVCQCSNVLTLMSAKGMRMPDSSMQMLCALRCSTREMAALRVVASFLKAVFSKICTHSAHKVNDCSCMLSMFVLA